MADQLEGAKLASEAGVDVPTVREHGTLQDGTPCIKCDLAKGDSVKVLTEQGRKLTQEEQIEILRMMHQANEKGIVMADLNSGNVRLFRDADGKLRAGLMESGSIGKTADLGKARQAQMEGSFLCGTSAEDHVKQVVPKVYDMGFTPGGLMDYVDPDLVAKYENPLVFQRYLDDVDSGRVALDLSRNDPGFQTSIRW